MFFFVDHDIMLLILSDLTQHILNKVEMHTMYEVLRQKMGGRKVDWCCNLYEVQLYIGVWD